MAEHATRPPSGADCWVHCAGALLAQAEQPEQPETLDSKEGTASHWVGSSILQSYLSAAPAILTPDSFVGKTAPNGVIITEEMTEGAALYARAVLKVAQEHGVLKSLQIEQRVFMAQVHDDCWGTPDCWVYDAKEGILYVWDYKYGHGFVDEYENWQLILYATGALNAAVFAHGLTDEHIRVVLTVVQPRYYRASKVRSWRLQASTLRPYINTAHMAAHAADKGETLTPGNHCRYCTARHTCEAAQRSAMSAVDISMAYNMVNYTPLALATELSILERAKKAIELRLTGLEEIAVSRISSGELIPGRALKPAVGNLAWTQPAAETIAAFDMLGYDVRKPDALLTPTQARDKFKVDESVIKLYADRPKKGFQLVKDGQQVRRIFTEEK